MAELGSPMWWMQRLSDRLDARRKRYNLLDRYYMGDHPLPEGDERCRKMFRQFQRKARTNYMMLVAEAVRERLLPVGFRFGGDGDSQADTDANRIWQANGLDADSGLVHQAAGSLSDAYVIVGPPPEGSEFPLITPEDPRQVVAEPMPGNRRELRAALKTWVDDAAETRYGVLYLPDSIHYFTAPAYQGPPDRMPGDPAQALSAGGWEEFDEPAVNPIGMVPVVRFVNAARLSGEGMGEFESVIDIQDRINDTILNRLVIAKLQAYRQRWIKGLPTEDEHGNPLDLPFVPGVDLLWQVDPPEGSDVEFGEFQQVDLTPLLRAVEADITALVTLTGLPPHYVAGDIVNASADALAAAESRLVAKVRERQRTFGESWERVMRLAFAYLEDPRADIVDAETLWADPERKSIAQMADAAVKAQAAGVPWRQRMVDLGYTPPQIDRMESERAAEEMLNAALAAPPELPAPEPAIRG